MLRAEQKWAVGDKVFPSEAEARFYLKSRCESLQRDNLVELLSTSWAGGLEPFTTLDAEHLADAILAAYDLKLRK